MQILGKCEGRIPYKGPCYAWAVNIHHKDRNHKNNDKNNLMKLCSACHAKEHAGENNLARLGEPKSDLCNEISRGKEGRRLMDGYETIEEGIKYQKY